ncbi:hypothetical protein [Desulfobulbus alkaliphilus]|uniref:hypothetical protein n=1 Tax=Desulfobulbus alkaliphilus TaxID=869814 RepID=UPI001962F423|nr:hypothetical protein [Desulfobulbus alkaliphilus]MBM9536932.1 hypothetical protein [Desulfobulbus alkaliphilus]
MLNFYSGTATEKVALAHSLHRTWERQHNIHGTVRDALQELRLSVEALTLHMRSMGMNQLCCHCASRPGGGCCSALMADNTDAIQILINLLLGIVVEPLPHKEDACCFLGEQGCLFLAKPHFCLNYNCSHIRNRATDQEMKTLYRHTSTVLGRQTRMETQLIEIFHLPSE